MAIIVIFTVVIFVSFLMRIFWPRKVAAEKFPIWDIEIGTHTTVEALVADIEAGGAKLDCWALRILPQVTVSPVACTRRLVALSVAELGFTGAASLSEIYARASVLGLELCPSEAALQLRHQYTTQPKGEFLLMAMDPLQRSDSLEVDLRVLYLAHGDEGLLLGADRGYSDRVCILDRRLLFALPRARCSGLRLSTW